MVRTEKERFDWADPAAKVFYDEHGYVIVRGVLEEDERAQVRPAFAALVEQAASAAGMTPLAFEERFPQNRDLWSKSDVYRNLLYGSRQGEVARHFLSSPGARLFHDHAIAKPAGRSATIPWHQDSTYWPLDRAGNSLWTPTEAVGADGGCLKVLDGSHKEKPGVPQDFLRPDGIDRDLDPRLVFLPVHEGETVVLHGLTWHSSDPNRSKVDRLAYLTLWVPSSARFAPDHAGWHPSAAHIDVEPGERLQGDWFPLFGAVGDVDSGEILSFEPPSVGTGLTMFKASEAIRRHLRFLAGQENATMAELLHNSLRSRLAAAAELHGCERSVVLSALEDLELQERVREHSVARDVYLTSVQRWWDVAGHRLEPLCP